LAADDDISPADRRALYRERLAELAEQNPEASGPELARMLASSLRPRERQVIVDDYLSALAIFAQQYRYMVSRDRRAVYAALDVTKTEAPTTADERTTIYDRINAWREHVPSIGYRFVLDMTRREVREALDQRMSKLMTEYWRTEVLRRLDAGLQHDDEQVKDRFSDDQIIDLITNIRKEMQRGNLRLRIQSSPTLPGPFTAARQAGRRNSS
jgi:hypothetical protein